MFSWFRRLVDRGPAERPRTAPFTELALRAIACAEREARAHRLEYLGTETLLLGLLRVEEGTARAVLARCGIAPGAVADAVEDVIGFGPPDFQVFTPMVRTPQAELALQWAAEEARFLAHSAVGTEHLLMGLLHTSEGVAAEVLGQFGLTAARGRAIVLELAPPGTV